MADLAAAVGLGGDCLADIAVLREQPWRLTIRDYLGSLGPDPADRNGQCAHPE
jgi:hypothetical protein